MRNTEWILVSNFPGFEKPVLVTDGKMVLIARLNEIRQVTTKESHSTYLEFLEGETGYENLWFTPTHWMNLPEPPAP